MPLDTSSYSLALLRLDGRRWNELRSLYGQISTQAAADGSAYFEMGNTKVICTIHGPEESSRRAQGAGGTEAQVHVEINIAGFSGNDRTKRSKNDKRNAELQHTISRAFSTQCFTHLYPHSTINVTLHVLTQDGSLLAACINAATLALVDAGIPMQHYISACTAGSTSSYSSNEEAADPLLDLNSLEEAELPFLTVATVGGTDQVSVLIMDTRVQMQRVEGMLALAIDGCRSILNTLDLIVKEHGKQVLEKAPGD
ncbi:MAG: hypothetical protein Q9162_001624 [Coniocarpon cinnabarinum]